eukprot:UN05364
MSPPCSCDTLFLFLFFPSVQLLFCFTIISSYFVKISCRNQIS